MDLEVSDLLRTRAARPESKTGVPYSLSMRRLAAGLPLWWYAIPVGRTAITALVWAVSLDMTLGRFPSTLLRMPTWSAELEKFIL